MSGILSFIKPTLRKHIVELVFYYCCTLCIIGISILQPYLTGDFIDLLIQENHAYRSIIVYCLIFFSLNALQLMIGFVENQIYTKLNNKLTFDMREDIIKHYQSLSLRYIEKQDGAFIAQRINYDTNILASFGIGLFIDVISNLGLLIASIWIVYRYSVFIAIMMAILCGVYIVCYTRMRRLLFAVQNAYLDEQAAFFSNMYRQFQQVYLIKIFGLFYSMQQRFQEHCLRLLQQSLKYQKVNYLYSSIDSVIQNLMQIVCFGIGGLLVVRGELTIGRFVVLTTFFSYLLNAIRYFFGLGQSIETARASYTHIKQWTDYPRQHNGKIRVEDVHHIRIHNLNFGYNIPLFKSFNLQFEKGKIYCLHGENGKGKTTLLEILSGLYSDQCGQNIWIDQNSMDTIDMIHFRTNNIGFVMQKPVLIPELLDCITDKGKALLQTFSESDALDWDVLSSLDLDALNLLSGGEKQKIAISHALGKQPPLLFLDEASSNLDDGSTNLLAKLLIQSKNERITIISSHDPRLISIADEVIELNERMVRFEKRMD